jgi:hypothetical protein
MNKQVKNIVLSVVICLGGIFSSCVDLDISPMNIINDETLMTSDDGMAIYMARMYMQMPFEDFMYTAEYGFFRDYQATSGQNEGSAIRRSNGNEALTREAFLADPTIALWTLSFQLLRDANYLLETLPAYRNSFPEERYNHYLGEGYFVRAFVNYTMAKRYGGIPLVLEVLKYPENPVVELEVARSTEEETWDRILSDFDMAASLLSETSPKRGYANKYVALGYKSEAMLFAGGVAKYNTVTGFGEKTGVRVIGFDPGTAAAASKRYFTEAYKAAREVMSSGKYSLYRAKWSATDRESQFRNMVDMFQDINSSENIYVKEYSFPDQTHGWSIYNAGSQFATGANGAFNSPVLDLVELYDGIEKYDDGTIKVFDKDDKNDPGRKYLMFDDPFDIFRNIEPRCRAFVMLPGDYFLGHKIDIRMGIYVGDVSGGIPPLMTKGGIVDYLTPAWGRYFAMDKWIANTTSSPVNWDSGEGFYLSNSRTQHSVIRMPDGTLMNAAGAMGPVTNDQYSTLTGFSVRKNIDESYDLALVASGVEARCDHHCVLLRYGQTLLDVAEAASELMLAGEVTVDGDNLRTIAFDAVQEIRTRAGADLMTDISEIDGQDGLMLIRKERRKELPFENKIVWDIRRWRTQHSDIQNGRTQEDGAYYKGLYPFMVAQTGKYFFDARIEYYNKVYRIAPYQYYFAIPGGEVAKSSVLDQQPGR